MKTDIKAQVAALQKEFQSYGGAVSKGVGRAVLKSCVDVEREAKELVSDGRERESEPGKPPRVDTGRLRSSITHRVKESGDKVVGEVGTNVEYATDLEFGSSHNWVHPFMGPAFDKHEAEIIDRIGKAEETARKAM